MPLLLSPGALLLGSAHVVPALAAPPPSPPSLVVAQGLTDATIELTWIAIPGGADSYSIYRDGGLTALGSTPATRFDDAGLTAKASHSYQVSSTVGGVASARSAPVSAITQAINDTAPPTQPGAIAVSNITSNSATLSWGRSHDDTRVLGYRVLRGAAGAPLSQLTQITTTDGPATYTDTHLKASTAYQFAVLAVDAAYNPARALSPPRTATLTTLSSSDTTIPTPPANSSVATSPFSSSRIDVVWGASFSTNVIGYDVLRDGTRVGEVDEPLRRYYSDNGLATGSSHQYQVRAISSAGVRSAPTVAQTVASTAQGVVLIKRGPYIQWPTANSVRIAWWTNIPAGSSVSYGTGGVLSSQVLDKASTTRHMMLIGGLSPGTTYSYQVASGGATSGTFTFATAAITGSTFTMSAVSDYGGGSAQETLIANQIAADHTQFVQTMSDNVYPDAQDPNFATTYSDFDARLYKPYGSVMSQQAMWFAIGNKEYYGDGAFFNNAWTPNNQRWYSYDWGDAHVLVLDTNQPYAPGTPQYDFAKADLIANQAKKWRIVAVEDPPYSSSTNNSSCRACQVNLTPLFEQQHVQLVLNGNSHNYERSFPLIQGKPVAQGAGGVTYVVSGGGGNGLNQFTIPAPAWSAFRTATYEHLRVTVSPTALKVDGIDSAGTLFDSTTISPTAPGAPQLVQAAGATESSASTSLTGTFSTSTSAGHLLALSAGVYTGTTNHITSVTDSGSNTWTRIGAFAVSGHNSDGEMWYAANANAVTSVTVHTTSAAIVSLAVQEFSGVATTSPLDVSAGTSNTGTSPGSGSVSPLAAGELAVGFIAGHSNPQAISVTAPGYSAETQQTSNGGGLVVASVVTGYQALTSASAQTFTGSFASSMYWAAGIACFKAGP